MNEIKFKKLLIFLIILTFTIIHSPANADEQYRTFCLQSTADFYSKQNSLVIVDPAGTDFAKWTLIWDGSSIYRESEIYLKGKQIGTPKQEIWSLRKFNEFGDGSIGKAPALQVKNAQRYFISRILAEIGKKSITAINAKALDKALSACEGVSDKVALDGQPNSNGHWKNGGDLAHELRIKIRNITPDLFKETPLAPKAIK